MADDERDKEETLDFTSESVDTQIPVIKTHPYEIRQVTLTDRQKVALLYGGICFLAGALFCIGGIVWLATKVMFLRPYQREQYDTVTAVDLANYYIPLLFNPVLLFISATLCSVVGYMMLRASGAVGEDVIPRQDFELLSKLMAEEKEKSIELYVRLASLSGFTGFFTKIGITGLPLATIFLTLIFAFLGFWATSAKLLDFANLTLGAFLGSYVQKRAAGQEIVSPKL